jgi:hypothetical protein
MGWVERLDGPQNVTGYAPGSDRVTISTTTVLIVHRSGRNAYLVTLYGRANAARPDPIDAPFFDAAVPRGVA